MRLEVSVVVGDATVVTVDVYDTVVVDSVPRLSVKINETVADGTTVTTMVCTVVELTLMSGVAVLTVTNTA
jgi:hypothetical protein